MRDRAYTRDKFEVAMPRSKAIDLGVCRLCGCTQQHACPGTRCAWVDASHTLCTACLPKLTAEELAALCQVEIAASGNFRVPPIELDFPSASGLLACLDMVLRHPRANDEGDAMACFEVARQIRDGLSKHLSQVGPATAEMFRRGQDPQYDRADELTPG